jgi:hypothetical protein
LCSPTRQGGPHGQLESGGRVLAVKAGARAPIGGVTRQGVVLTDLHSLLDCQQHFSLSLSLSLSLSSSSSSSPPPPPPPSPSSSCFSCSSWTHRTLDNCSSADLVSNTVARSRAASFSFSVVSLNKPWSRAASRSFSAFGLNKPPRPPFLLLLPLSSSHFGQQLSRLLLGNAVGGKTGVHGEGLFESRSSFLLLPHSLIDLSELNRGGEIGFASVGLEQALYCLVV